jgi:hypothetical protein
MLVVDKGEFGFSPLIVVFAESLPKAPWWRYHTLIQGDNSEKLGVDDPDCFCVYNFATKKIVWMLSHTPSRGGHIFRIHDGVKARFTKRDDQSAGVAATGGVTGKMGVHQCVDQSSGPGKVNWVKDKAAKTPPCDDRDELRIDSQGLKFPWVLPAHLTYDSKMDVQWVAP